MESPKEPIIRVNKNILFIGNSYTSQIRDEFRSIVAGSPYRNSELGFLTKSDSKLARHYKNKSTIGNVKSGNWSVVVLQDHSQEAVANPASFNDAVDDFSKITCESGASLALYSTWARKEVDRVKGVTIEFSRMQPLLTKAYNDAGIRNDALVVPVGEVWQELRVTSIGEGLYSSDGSHPSSKGAKLTALVFYHYLFDAPLDDISSISGLSKEELSLFKTAILSVKDRGLTH